MSGHLLSFLPLLLQDLQCSKCRGVKELNMPLFCACAGKFRPMAANAFRDLRQLLKTFQGIAREDETKQETEETK